MLGQTEEVEIASVLSVVLGCLLELSFRFGIEPREEQVQALSEVRFGEVRIRTSRDVRLLERWVLVDHAVEFPGADARMSHLDPLDVLAEPFGPFTLPGQRLAAQHVALALDARILRLD